MASFVRIDENGIVIDSVKVADSDAPDEASGAAYISALLGGEWVQTYYSGSPRKFAGIGWKWDGKDFIAPDPGPEPPDYPDAEAL